MDNATAADSEALKLIDAIYPGFQEPLRAAHVWVIEGGERLPAAIRVLKHLRNEYPNALQVGAELMLAYLQADRRDEALQELELLEGTFPVDRDEETLCRFGRLHREIGDDYVKDDEPTDEQFRLAAREYELAWNYYDRAFNIPNRGGHYPGINRASLFLLMGWATRTSDLRARRIEQSRQAATRLLARRDNWPHENPEDGIWHLASAAEAQLLLGMWDDAIVNYRLAVTHNLAVSFHRESIGKEARRMQRPLREVNGLPDDTIAKLNELFPPPARPVAPLLSTPA